MRQVFAFSGMLQAASDARTNFDLTAYALTLAPQQRGHGHRAVHVDLTRRVAEEDLHASMMARPGGSTTALSGRPSVACAVEAPSPW